MVDTIGPPTSANAGGPLGTLGSFPQFKTGGSDSSASRILEEVGIVAEMRDSAVQQLRTGLNSGKDAAGVTNYVSSTCDHLRERSEAIRASDCYKLCALGIVSVSLNPNGLGHFAKLPVRNVQRLNSSHQDGYAITFWVKGVRCHPARNLVS
jgi:hypothetical protein